MCVLGDLGRRRLIEDCTIFFHTLQFSFVNMFPYVNILQYHHINNTIAPIMYHVLWILLIKHWSCDVKDYLLNNYLDYLQVIKNCLELKKFLGWAPLLLRWKNQGKIKQNHENKCRINSRQGKKQIHIKVTVYAQLSFNNMNRMILLWVVTLESQE